jgi:SAM-dependent methyltransferase
MLVSSLRWIARAPLQAISGPIWYCPICDHHGHFVPFNERWHARCWHCGSLERHRLLWHALCTRIEGRPSWRVLHVAPESCLRQHLTAMFEGYVTGDLNRTDVTMPGLDICAMPFGDGDLDMVIASHVLEHVEHDDQAIREIHRVLRPGGVALLPVPWAAQPTIEFGAPRADEMGHWRRPGLDYLDRYRELFEVELVMSDDVPAEWQAQMHRTKTKVEWLPYDVVPVCRKGERSASDKVPLRRLTTRDMSPAFDKGDIELPDEQIRLSQGSTRAEKRCAQAVTIQLSTIEYDALSCAAAAKHTKIPRLIMDALRNQGFLP